MSGRRQMFVLATAGLVAACAPGPEYRWMKAGVNAKVYEADRTACLATVDREFNPYYDYGPMISGGTASGQRLFRDQAAEEMYRDCMRHRGYRLIAIEPPQQQY